MLFHNMLNVARSRSLSTSRYSSLSPLEMIGLTLRESFRAMSDPYLRGDSVAAVGETTGEVALRNLRDTMKRHKVGAKILKDRPLINKALIDVEYLHNLPADTVGGSFGRYMSMHGFELGERMPTRYIEDEELAFVMQRYRDTHDLMHAVLGIPVSVTGEIALKWFEMVQTQLPMTALAAFFGTLRAETAFTTQSGSGNHQDSLLGEYRLYCIRAAKHGELFLNIYYEESWEENIVDFRKRHGFPKLPDGLPSLDASWDLSRVEPIREHYKLCIDALASDRDPRRKLPFQTYLANLDKLSPAK